MGGFGGSNRSGGRRAGMTSRRAGSRRLGGGRTRNRARVGGFRRGNRGIHVNVHSRRRLHNRYYRPRNRVYIDNYYEETYSGGGFISSGSYRQGKHRYGAGPYLEYQKTRLQRIHNYIPITNDGKLRTLLPPNNHNFVFLDIPFEMLDNYSTFHLPPIPSQIGNGINNDMIAKLPDLTQLSIQFHKVLEDYLKTHDISFCNCTTCMCGLICPCCILPMRSAEVAEDKKDALLDGIGQACQTINKQTASRGITFSFINDEVDDDDYGYNELSGFILEVAPVLENGQANQYWSGPNLAINNNAIKQAVITNLQIEQGVQFQEAQFKQIMDNAISDADNFTNQLDEIDSLAHQQALFEVYSSLNQLYSPFLLSTQQQLASLALKYGINAETNLLKARTDLNQFTTTYAQEWQQDVNTVQQTKTAEQAQATAKKESNEFCDACSLPPVPDVPGAPANLGGAQIVQVQPNVVVNSSVQQQPNVC